MRNGRLRQVKHCVDVHVERLPPLLITDLADFLKRGLVRGIVDENVDAPKFTNGTLHNRATVVGITNVTNHQNGLTSFLFD